MTWSGRRRRGEDTSETTGEASAAAGPAEAPPEDPEVGQGEPDEPLLTPTHLRWAAAVSAVTLVFTALSGSTKVADIASGHGISAKVAGYIAGGNDRVLDAVDDAHEAMNAYVWYGRSTARRQACDHLERAVEAAAELDYTDAEISEIGVRLDGCRTPSVPGEQLHDQIQGLESYLRLGQGR